MRGAMYEIKGSSEWMRNAKEIASDGVGNMFSLTVSRESLDDDNIMQLDKNEQITYTGVQCGLSDVSGGSVVNMADGEIRVGFLNVMVVESVGCLSQHSRGSLSQHSTRHKEMPGVKARIPFPNKLDTVYIKMRLENQFQHRTWSERVVLCALSVVFANKPGSRTQAFNPDLPTQIHANPEKRFSHRGTHSAYTREYDCCLPHFLALFLRENRALVQHTSTADSGDGVDEYFVGKQWNALTCLPRHDKYLTLMMLGVAGGLAALHAFCRDQSPNKTELVPDGDRDSSPAGVVTATQPSGTLPPTRLQGPAGNADTGTSPSCQDSPSAIAGSVFPYRSESVFSVGALYFTLHTALKSVYDLCHDIVFKILMVSTGKSGWEYEHVGVLRDKLVRIHELIQREHGEESGQEPPQGSGLSALISGERGGDHMTHERPSVAAPLNNRPEKRDLRLLGKGLLQSTQVLRKMHPHARSFLVPEMLGDVVYVIFFGGRNFTYTREKAHEKIMPDTSALQDIQQELQYRLGFLPAVDISKQSHSTQQQEKIRRDTIKVCIQQNLLFNRSIFDKDIYEYRNKVSYAPIALDSPALKLVRSFKNATRQHHSHVLHAANTQSRRKYRETVFDFLHRIAQLIVPEGVLWVEQELRETVAKKAALISAAHCDLSAYQES